jgi:hypothetical protein
LHLGNRDLPEFLHYNDAQEERCRVLDASVGKVHLVIVVRQLVLTRPASDLLWLSIGSPVAVLAAAIPVLKEALVIPLEFVVQNDSADLAALFD